MLYKTNLLVEIVNTKYIKEIELLKGVKLSEKIKENKLKKYKKQRRRNRTKLLFMSFFLLLSFCSVVVYPVFKDNLNKLPNILT